MEDYIEQDPTLRERDDIYENYIDENQEDNDNDYGGEINENEIVNDDQLNSNRYEYTYDDLAKVFLDIENEIKIIFKRQNIDLPYVFEDFIVDLFYRSYVCDSDIQNNIFYFCVDDFNSDIDNSPLIYDNDANSLDGYYYCVEIIYASIIANFNIYNILNIPEFKFKTSIFKIFLYELLQIQEWGKITITISLKPYDEFILELKNFMRNFDQDSYITNENLLKEYYTDLKKMVEYNNYFNMNNDDLNEIIWKFERWEGDDYKLKQFNYVNLNNFINIFADLISQSTYIHPEIKNRDSFFTLYHGINHSIINLDFFQGGGRKYNEIKNLMNEKLKDFFRSKVESYLYDEYYSKPIGGIVG